NEFPRPLEERVNPAAAARHLEAGLRAPDLQIAAAFVFHPDAEDESVGGGIVVETAHPLEILAGEVDQGDQRTRRSLEDYGARFSVPPELWSPWQGRDGPRYPPAW